LPPCLAEAFLHHLKVISTYLISRQQADRKIAECLEDIKQAIAGNEPTNAKITAVFFDGGSTIWSSEGYEITVLKRLVTKDGIAGWERGATVRLDASIAGERKREYQYVTFIRREK
jgi:hypothetical protein